MRYPVVRYGVALCVTLLAAILRGFLGAQSEDLVPFLTFFPAVLAATLIAGLGPGLLSIGLGAFLAWFFWLQPAADPAIAGTAVGLKLGLFVLASLTLVAAAEATRRYYDRSLVGERRFRAAEDLALDGFGILEAIRDAGGALSDFRWTYANPALRAALRRDDALVGRRLLELFPGHRARSELFSTYAQVVATGAPKEVEIFYDADGIRGWFRVNAVKLDDGVALSLRDVTTRKEREAALQESEARFRLLADAVDDVFWIIDLRDRKVVYVSPAAERNWGLPRSVLEKDPKTWRERLHPADRSLADPVFEEMLEERRQTFELVYRMRGADGSWRWVRDKASLVRAGEMERVVGVVTDITAAKAAEEQQRLIARELDHRLKNTYALVQSIVRLSARGAHDVDQLADSLESRIQALARSQDVIVKGSRGVTLLEEIVRDTLAPYAGRDGQIRIEGPPIEVGARDVPLLHMGFHELATNAIKYGALSVPGGKIEVTWERIADPAEAIRLRWSESGGPLVRPPVRKGLGSNLVEHALASEFGGEIEIAFPPTGVVCTMRLPLSDQRTLGRSPPWSGADVPRAVHS